MEQLISGFYRVGTLSLFILTLFKVLIFHEIFLFCIAIIDKDGWQYWFLNSTDEDARSLIKNLEFVDDVEEGLSNVTQAFFWGYAFLGSRAQLQYIVTNNISME